MDPFQQQLGEAAANAHNFQSWSPNVGDRLIGRYLGMEQVPTKYGIKPVMKVRDEASGEALTVWMNVVLVSEFEREQPTIGDRIGIERLEDGKQTKGNPPKRYVMRVDRTAPARVLDMGQAQAADRVAARQQAAQAAPSNGVSTANTAAGTAAAQAADPVTAATRAAYERLVGHPLLTEVERQQYTGFLAHPQFTETRAKAGIERLHEVLSEREPPAVDIADGLPF